MLAVRRRSGKRARDGLSQPGSWLHRLGNAAFMVALVRIALSRPYTFIVLALLILIAGPLAALKTPTDIFPNIGVPVIGVAWTYNGLPPDEMAGRIITPYERTLPLTVSNIEHIESQSLAGMGIVKIYFQPGADM